MRHPEAEAGADIHAALASPVRRQLLTRLRAAGSALDVHELALEVGLHLTTVRFHLEVLRRAGLLERRTQPSGGAGRPRTVYAPAQQLVTNADLGYQRLARHLSAHLSTTRKKRAARAERAGIAWADEVFPAAEDRTCSLDDASERMTAVFAGMGFDPELTTVGDVRHIALHACPFRLVADEYPEVVCSMHLGLLRGGLSRLGAAAHGSLRPFVTPDLCIAQLAPPATHTPSGSTPAPATRHASLADAPADHPRLAQRQQTRSPEST